MPGVDYYLCGHALCHAPAVVAPLTLGPLCRVFCGVSPCYRAKSQARSASTAAAAFLPLVAITLPAGWVAAPQRYTPGIGRARGEPVLPHLVGTHLALEDVPAGEPDPRLDVRSAEHLVVLEAVLEVGREARDEVDELARDLVAVARPSRR